MSENAEADILTSCNNSYPLMYAKIKKNKLICKFSFIFAKQSEIQTNENDACAKLIKCYLCRMNQQLYSSKLLENVVSEFSKLPGIGKKTALRMALFLLKQDKDSVKQFGEAVIQIGRAHV